MCPETAPNQNTVCKADALSSALVWGDLTGTRLGLAKVMEAQGKEAQYARGKAVHNTIP